LGKSYAFIYVHTHMHSYTRVYTYIGKKTKKNQHTFFKYPGFSYKSSSKIQLSSKA